MRLKDRVAIVTGAARGIGAAVCRAYAREGAAVAINYFDYADMAQSLAEEIGASGGRAVAVHGDITRRDEVDRLVAAAHEHFGPVDILVHNAALAPRTSWHAIAEEEWNRVLAVNLTGALLCAQAVYPDMQALGRGSIITVSSVTVELGMGPMLHYVSSKAALIGFTRSLAREAGRDGIRVNCVMPGAIRTEDELERFPNQDEIARQQAERQSLPRRGTADDLAGAFVFLASAESDFVTGQVINVDGGWVHY
jgi:3-oxoacyl-[acyl-carrier protein] reductase